MRQMLILVVVALLTAACERGPEPTQSGQSTPGSKAAPTEPGKALPRPSDADLHGAPSPTDEDLRELYDISRDLQAVAAGENGAVRDLADDLARFAPPERDAASLNRVADSMGSALKGKRLDEPSAARLAVLLYVIVHADEMSAAQRSAASAQLRETLGAVGVARAQADAVVSQMPQAAAR